MELISAQDDISLSNNTIYDIDEQSWLIDQKSFHVFFELISHFAQIDFFIDELCPLLWFQRKITLWLGGDDWRLKFKQLRCKIIFLKIL